MPHHRRLPSEEGNYTQQCLTLLFVLKDTISPGFREQSRAQEVNLDDHGGTPCSSSSGYHLVLRFTFPLACPRGPCKNISLNTHLAMFSEVILHLLLKHQNQPPAGLAQVVSRATRGFPWVTVASAAVAFLLPLDEGRSDAYVSAGHTTKPNDTLIFFLLFF